MIIKRWLVSLLCCCMVVSSCTTLRKVPLTAGAPPVSSAGIKPGDTVMITLRDGTRRELKVQQVEAEALTGGTRSGAEVARFAFADMQTLEVRRVSFWKTTGAVGATLVVIGAAILAAYIHALTHGEEE
jgi:hypothetical protein